MRTLCVYYTYTNTATTMTPTEFYSARLSQALAKGLKYCGPISIKNGALFSGRVKISFEKAVQIIILWD